MNNFTIVTTLPEHADLFIRLPAIASYTNGDTHVFVLSEGPVDPEALFSDFYESLVEAEIPFNIGQLAANTAPTTGTPPAQATTVWRFASPGSLVGLTFSAADQVLSASDIVAAADSGTLMELVAKARQGMVPPLRSAPPAPTKTVSVTHTRRVNAIGNQSVDYEIPGDEWAKALSDADGDELEALEYVREKRSYTSREISDFDLDEVLATFEESVS